MIRWTPAAAGLLVVAVALTGCSRSTEPEIAPSKAKLYVALGDSYTAGPRLGENTGPAGCEQTAGNYPHLLAKRLDLRLVDASCGGAVSDNLTAPQTPPNGSAVPPQLDALTEDTALVTLSMGGNDDKTFNQLMTTCIGLGVAEPDGAPCTEIAEKEGERFDARFTRLADRIESSVNEIRERSPQARIVVVGYPQIFPGKGTCAQLALAAADYPLAYDIARRLAGAQEEGARRSGAEYADVWTATSGHDMCADDPWIAGAAPEQSALPYHPYAAEQVAVADLLADLLADLVED